MKRNFDAVILGGGASGLMCAITAKQKNPQIKIAIIEKNDRVGKKLLSTGNGRCNLTNANESADRYTGSFGSKADAILKRYDTQRILDCFADLGLQAAPDSEGRYYPLCRQASAVVDVLRFACERSGVEVFCGENVKSLKKQGEKFCVTTFENTFIADKLVIACGSKAAPKLGGSASAADYLKNLGHTIVPFSPALCPVKVGSALLKSLKGIRTAATVSLIRNGKTIRSESGEVQFTDNALSGICVFNLSLYTKADDIIELDLYDYISDKDLYLLLQQHQQLFAALPCDNLLTGIFHKRLAQAILKAAGVTSFSLPCSDLTENDLRAVARTIRHFVFRVTENSGFEQAQCAKGGVLGSEIDERTMQSKKCRSLYVCGEAIDICGECGGYNLHFAFASGRIAGESL